MKKGQLGRGGELAERRGDAGQAVTVGVSVQPFGEELVFDGPGTAHTPVRGGHFLDHALLDAIDGDESLQMFPEYGFKALQ
jgi:hypothetical protein